MNKPKSRIETLDAAEVATLLNAGKLLLIDVREPAEYASERIAGALLYPLSTFDATSLSRAAHFDWVRLEAHVDGIAAWKAAGLPVITPGTPR